MFIFKKIRIPNSPDKVNESWSLILNSIDAVQAYMQNDARLFGEAFMSLPTNLTKSHLSAPRERVLNIAIQTQGIRNNEFNEKKTGLDVISNIVDGKFRNMIKMVMDGNVVKINHVGGYCDYAGFMRVWDEAEVVQEIHSNELIWPNEKEPIKAEYLFLENAERVDVVFQNSVLKDKCYTTGLTGKIETLKEKDPIFVIGSITNCPNICIKSALLDEAQFDISGKTLHLDVPEDKLKKHELYEEVSQKHNIIFY